MTTGGTTCWQRHKTRQSLSACMSCNSTEGVWAWCEGQIEAHSVCIGNKSCACLASVVLRQGLTERGPSWLRRGLQSAMDGLRGAGPLVSVRLEVVCDTPPACAGTPPATAAASALAGAEDKGGPPVRRTSAGPLLPSPVPSCCPARRLAGSGLAKPPVPRPPRSLAPMDRASRQRVAHPLVQSCRAVISYVPLSEVSQPWLILPSMPMQLGRLWAPGARPVCV